MADSPARFGASYRLTCLMRVARILVFAAAALPLTAGEFVVFSSGQRMPADRHERSGDTFLLYRGGGVTTIPAAVVLGFEPDERPEPPAAAEPAPTAESSWEGLEVVRPADARTLVREAALRSGLPPAFVESVALVESAFREDAVSPKGAIGVMQLMPGTAKALGADPRDVRQNIDAGTRLLRELLIKYDGDVVKALAAYNAGSGAVDRYQGVPPYDETRHYVNKVIGAYQRAGGK
jgi:soluble lytic murein transglycosylase-like protein